MGQKFKYEFAPIKEGRERFAEAHTGGELLPLIEFSSYSLKLHSRALFKCIGCGEWFIEPYYLVFRDNVLVSTAHRLCKVCAYNSHEIEVRLISTKWSRRLKRLR